jgi:phytoene desaturase
MPRKKVVVVGAGPGGLAAALQLAHAGAEVTVLEARDVVGGRCSSMVTPGGFTFDIGPTFYLYPRILKEILQSIGRDIDREIPMVRLDPQYRVAFGAGGQLDCTPNLERMDRQIAQLSPPDAGKLKKYLDHNRTKLAKFRPILESPFNGIADYLSSAFLAAAPFVTPWKTLGRDLESYFKDPRLVIAFSFQAKYLGMSPFRCPSLFSILSFLEYEYGVFHPHGGCGAVSRELARIARETGCDIRLNEPVRSLQWKGKRVVGVATDRGTYDVDGIVMNADFAHAMQHLVPNHLRTRWTDEKIETKRFSCSTFMMYLGLNRVYEHLPHHTIHISRDYLGNLREIEQEKVLPRDPSFYVHNPVVTDSTLAPPGKSSLYILVPVPHLSLSTPWDAEQTTNFRKLTLQRLREVGLEDVERHIEFEKVITPQNWRDDFRVYRGATFNLAHNLGQMLHLRPRNKFEDLDGVYLVGGGTHPGSGLPVIYESTRITCRQMLADLDLPNDFIDRLQPLADDAIGSPEFAAV